MTKTKKTKTIVDADCHNFFFPKRDTVDQETTLCIGSLLVCAAMNPYNDGKSRRARSRRWWSSTSSAA